MTRISKETIDKIMDTVRIEEVIGEFVNLKKSGQNFKGFSPFVDEKNPSFFVSPAKNIFKCFSSNKGGSVVTFLMEHEHYTYPEALRFLAKRYGIEIEEEDQSPEEKEKLDEREALFQVNTVAQKFFADQLLNTDEGKSVGLSYFSEREYNKEIIEKFGLGYSPNKWDALTLHCLEKGYKPEYLVKTGLTIEKEEGKRYDRFRSRVIFPIHNLSGRVVGFGGRILTREENKPKYVNSPESEIYNKSNVLYGLNLAKSEIIRQDKCYLVEGYTDVISMYKAGFENVVSSSGTALTVEQIRLIKRFTKNITILYDGDEAGIMASFRGIDLILEQGLNVKIIMFPPEEDPDSYVRNHRTAEIKEFFAQEKDFIRFKTGLLLESTKDDPVKKATLIREIVETISLIPDSIYRNVYIKECSSLLDTPEQVLVNELNRIFRKKFRKEQQQEEPQYVSEITETKIPPTGDVDYTNSEFQEREIIRLLMQYGTDHFIIHHETEIAPGMKRSKELSVQVGKYLVTAIRADDLVFNNPIYQMIFDEYYKLLMQGETPDEKNFINHEMEQVRATAADLLSSPYTLSENWEKKKIIVSRESGNLNTLVDSSLLSFKIKKIELQISRLQEKIKSEDSKADIEFLLKEMTDLKNISRKFNHDLSRIITH
ncbi:MAG: DNA primase [Bacteroidales bacterium]|nr:DNA primase [Bacteroidales bacterium]